MSLKDLKHAAQARQKDETPAEPVVQTMPLSEPTTEQVNSVQGSSSPPVSSPADGRTKLLGARVLLGVHREWQGHLYRAQEQQPNLTTQSALPVLIRLLRDDVVWQKFMAEIGKDS